MFTCEVEFFEEKKQLGRTIWLYYVCRPKLAKYGAVAQLGERHVRNVEVVGSIPICSIKIRAGSFGRRPAGLWERVFTGR